MIGYAKADVVPGSWKLMVYMDRVAVGNAIQTRCYMFDFHTYRAAHKAETFYIERGCRTIVIEDPPMLVCESQPA